MGVADTSGIYFIVIIFFQRQMLYEDKNILQLQSLCLQFLTYMTLDDKMDHYPHYNGSDGSSQDHIAPNHMKFELH